MATEIERKFLVRSEEWRAHTETSTPYIQGYLSVQPSQTVRVRLKGDKGVLTIKGASEGAARLEFEYSIPADDARALLAICATPPIQKVRHRVPVGDHVWEVDVFEGANAGLVMAEVELGAVDEVFELPGWAGEEVTRDHRYFNAWLAQHPFTTWKDR